VLHTPYDADNDHAHDGSTLHGEGSVRSVSTLSLALTYGPSPTVLSAIAHHEESISPLMRKELAYRSFIRTISCHHAFFLRLASLMNVNERFNMKRGSIWTRTTAIKYKYGALPTRRDSEQVSANTAAWKVSPLFELPQNFLRNLILLMRTLLE
jgi:hypothetical protein